MNYLNKLGLFAGFTIMSAVNYYTVMSIVVKEENKKKAIGEALLIGGITSAALGSTTDNIKTSAMAYFPILVGSTVIKVISDKYTEKNMNNNIIVD